MEAAYKFIVNYGTLFVFALTILGVFYSQFGVCFLESESAPWPHTSGIRVIGG